MFKNWATHSKRKSIPSIPIPNFEYTISQKHSTEIQSIQCWTEIFSDTVKLCVMLWKKKKEIVRQQEKKKKKWKKKYKKKNKKKNFKKINFF